MMRIIRSRYISGRACTSRVREFGGEIVTARKPLLVQRQRCANVLPAAKSANAQRCRRTRPRARRSIAGASPRAAESCPRGLVLVGKPRHQLRRTHDTLDRANALARTPDIAPGLGPAAAGGEVHLAG